MTARRPKDIGTAAETAVVWAARDRGFGAADRYALHGSGDIGDIKLCPGVIVEVKGGHMAWNASDRNVEDWLDETDRERDAAGATFAFLVVQRQHVGARNACRWWAYARLSWLILGPTTTTLHMPIRMTLDDMLTVVLAAGYPTGA